MIQPMNYGTNEEQRFELYKRLRKSRPEVHPEQWQSMFLDETAMFEVRYYVETVSVTGRVFESMRLMGD
jgi:hypothetical protein